MFALRTNGGNEFCGQVIKSAVDGLTWRDDPGVFKVIYIAGNEPFTQGPINYREVCPLARKKGILVNTIHCGIEKQGVDGRWKDGALLADSMAFNIDQDEKQVAIESPQDGALIKLNELLNATYIPFGKKGISNLQNQTVQDSNAGSVSRGVLASRAGSKVSHLYCNDTWDVVDACDNKKIDLEKIDRDELPPVMRDMTLTQRKEYVAKKKAEREDLKKQIARLTAERNEYVEKKRRELKVDSTLERAIIESIHTQAKKLGFQFTGDNIAQVR